MVFVLLLNFFFFFGLDKSNFIYSVLPCDYAQVVFEFG